MEFFAVNDVAVLVQAERIKKWCQNHLAMVVFCLLLAVVFLMGCYFWQKHQENKWAAAAVNYDKFLSLSSASPKAETTIELAETIMHRYVKSPYAALTALVLAQQAIQQNNLAEAERYLTWVIERSKNKTLCAVARARLARVLLADNRAEYALKVLDNNESNDYQALMLERKGDIFSHLGLSQAALESYTLAKQLYQSKSVDSFLLAFKINSLEK